MFEAPIDMLSFITLYPENWQRQLCSLLRHIHYSAVLQMLEQVPQLDTILLCLDNDEAGHRGQPPDAGAVGNALFRGAPNPGGNKDWNDDLTLSRKMRRVFL